MRAVKGIGVCVCCVVVAMTAACGQAATGVAPTAQAAAVSQAELTANGGAPDGNASPNALVARVRQATTQYHDVAAALQAGYAADPVCASNPSGPGAMGFHYVNPSLASTPGVDPLQPEVVLYEPTQNGGRKLVAVEYLEFVRVRNPDGSTSPWVSPNPPDWSTVVTTRPSLFGQPFDGPMPGHNPSMPWHYELHVWAWQANPTGLFSSWNPNVSCTP